MVSPGRLCLVATVIACVLALAATVLNIVQLRGGSAEWGLIAGAKTTAAAATPAAAQERARRALGVPSLGRVQRAAVQRIRSLRGFADVYGYLGHRAAFVPVVELEGQYEARWLPLGVWRSMLDAVSLGGSSGATTTWTGKRFVPSTRITDAWGNNVFTSTRGQLTRGQKFVVGYNMESALDGLGGAVILDYGEGVGQGYFSMQRGELRCFSKDLCVGLAGLWPFGGVRNGMPFVLYRDNEEGLSARATGKRAKNIKKGKRKVKGKKRQMTVNAGVDL